MDYSKFKSILSRISYTELQDCIDQKLLQELSEWSCIYQDDNCSKNVLIELLVNSYDGYSVFKNEKFRKVFFKSVDYQDLQRVLPDFHKDAKRTDFENYSDIANKAARIPFGDNHFYRRLIGELFNSPDFEFEKSVDVQTKEIVPSSEPTFFELLDYQYLVKQQACYELERKDSIDCNVLIQMPTGTGKTKTTMHIITQYLNTINKNDLVLWIAHTNELLGQAVDSFEKVWSHLGTREIEIEKSWGKQPLSLEHGVVFVSIQSLISMKDNNPTSFERLKKLSHLIVYDECHKIGAEKTSVVIKELTTPVLGEKKKFIGLTATPGRTTGQSAENRRFANFFTRSIIINTDFISLVQSLNMSKNEAANAYKYDDAIKYFQDRHVLSVLKKEKLDYSADPALIDRLKKEFYKNKDEYSQKIIDDIANCSARNKAIIGRLRDLNSENIPTIVFACSLTHARLLSSFLNTEGIKNSLVTGEMSRTSRERAIKDFKNGKVNIIVNYDILTTGFDSTNIRCVFITRPTKSVILYSQMIGRGLRGKLMGGNDECLLIDMKENLDTYNESEAFSHFKSYIR